jgi:hypothetical protein
MDISNILNLKKKEKKEKNLARERTKEGQKKKKGKD